MTLYSFTVILIKVVQNIGYATALEAEFSVVMYAIEKVVEMRWNNMD